MAQRPLTIKRQRFVKEVVANGGNATEAVMKAFKPKKRATARSMGAELLATPRIRTEIMRLFEANNIDMPFLLKNHKRNIEQSENFGASQSAIKDAYELLGLNNKEKSSVAIAFVIE